MPLSSCFDVDLWACKLSKPLGLLFLMVMGVQWSPDTQPENCWKPRFEKRLLPVHRPQTLWGGQQIKIMFFVLIFGNVLVRYLGPEFIKLLDSFLVFHVSFC